jgi:hypothetical protein
MDLQDIGWVCVCVCVCVCVWSGFTRLRIGTPGELVTAVIHLRVVATELLCVCSKLDYTHLPYTVSVTQVPVCLLIQNGCCVQWNLWHVLCNKTVGCENAKLQGFKRQSVCVHQIH